MIKSIYNSLAPSIAKKSEYFYFQIYFQLDKTLIEKVTFHPSKIYFKHRSITLATTFPLKLFTK